MPCPLYSSCVQNETLAGTDTEQSGPKDTKILDYCCANIAAMFSDFLSVRNKCNLNVGYYFAEDDNNL